MWSWRLGREGVCRRRAGNVVRNVVDVLQACSQRSDVQSCLTLAEFWSLICTSVHIVPVVREVQLEDSEPILCRLLWIGGEANSGLCDATPVVRQQFAVLCNGPRRAGTIAIDLL